MKIIDVWAEWCGPCKLFEPVLQRLEHERGVEVERVNADQNVDWIVANGVQSIPTLLVYDDDGNEFTRVIGYQPYNRLLVSLGYDKKEQAVKE